MLIGVFLGLACWVAAISYLILPSIEYWQAASQIEAARQAARASFEEADRRMRDERLGEQLEALLRDVAGVLMFIVGLSIMAAVLPGAKVVALTFGLACVGGFWWLYQHYRRNWSRYARGGHRQEVLLHLAGMVLFPIVGVLLLLSVF